jgi:hypothetical protein
VAIAGEKFMTNCADQVSAPGNDPKTHKNATRPININQKFLKTIKTRLLRVSE